ncbi:MAG: DNA replication/repair protein RecF, partial [Treponema sp.]|nr:DNA replication/repair protein RecF [Treponema sp.]
RSLFREGRDQADGESDAIPLSSHTTCISYNGQVKKIEKDGKIIHDRKELINTIPCVLYSHDDLDFAVGSPERRRFFIDQSLSMYDELYIDVSRRYKRVLKSRNLCLKEKKYSLLESYDIQLVQNGLEIQKKRKNAIFTFNQIFGKLYEDVSGIGGVTIQYVPSWKKTTDQQAEESIYGDRNIPSIDEVLDGVRARREAESVMSTTLTGPHRDRITFARNGETFVPTASTGQRRLIALSLRTAQAVFYKQVTGKKPVLLMDDVMLELDPDKRQKVTALLPEYDQLFCTFLPGEPYERYRHETTKVFTIQNGNWTDSK